MANTIFSFTPITMFFERGGIHRSWTSKDCSDAHRIATYFLEYGIYNMERLNSMTKEEILSVPSIEKKEYSYIEETLEDFKATYGDLQWEMPIFDKIEFAYIVHVLIYRKPQHYFDLYRIFDDLSEDKNQHPLLAIMSQIYYKLRTIERDEFAVIMAEKGVNIEDYGI